MTSVKYIVNISESLIQCSKYRCFEHRTDGVNIFMFPMCAVCVCFFLCVILIFSFLHKTDSKIPGGGGGS